MALFSLLSLLVAANHVQSARIAGFVAIGGSGYINMKHTLEELVSRGHEVSMVVSSLHKIKPNEKVPHKIYQVTNKPGFIDEMVQLELQGRKLQFMLKMSETLAELCEGALSSTQVLNQLKGFDLILYDSISSCGALVGELLDIPRVEIMPVSPITPFAYPHMIPMPVSYIPQPFLPFTDKMTFVERVVNLGAYIGFQLGTKFVKDRAMNALKVKYNIKPERDFRETVGDAEMVIITADFALEYPQPLLPGQVMVGPLSVGDARPLSRGLDEFVSNSGGHGFIIVSFGSNVASLLPREVVDMLATAFGKLKQRVVWRLQGTIELHKNWWLI